MRTLFRLLVLLLLAVSLHAQSKLAKYSVLKTENGEAFLNILNQLADQGYCVLLAGKYTVLRLDAAPPDTYRYLRREVRGGPAQFTNWMNEQGAHGYRWLPRTELLEKAPHPRNHEYRYSPRGALGPSKESDLTWVIHEGYHPVGHASFSHALGADTSEMFFEREVAQPAKPSPISPGGEIRVADAMRAGNVMKRVDELARQGYRFLSPHDPNKGGGLSVMMEKCRDDCAGRYEYRYFDARDAAQIERDLNALGKDGFQVVPAALTWRPHLLEHDTRVKKTFSYRALGSIDAPGLEHLLNAADEDGYVPLDFVWHIGWTASTFLLLEKETTAAAYQ